MAITFVASSIKEDSTNAISRTVNVPAGVADGDLIVLAVTHAGGSTTNSASGLSGLVVLGHNQLSGITSSLYYKVNASASDAGTAITVTLSSSLRTSIVCLVFRGAATSGNPFDVQQNTGGAFGTTVVSPTGTTTSQSLELQVAAGSKSTIFGTPWQAPAGITTVVDAYTSGADTGNSGLAVGWAASDSAAGASIGGDVWTPPENVNWAAWTLAIAAPSLHKWQDLQGGSWRPLNSLVVGDIPVPPVGTPTEGLAWELDYATLSASNKKVLAHYFGPYPRSINNASSMATDSYTTAFNNPEYSEYRDYGSMFRDRPIFRPKLAGDFKYQDCVWDIEQAQAAGLDGFYCDLLGLSGSNYDNYMSLITAANDMNTGFKVVPMIDGNGATGPTLATPSQAADHVRKYFLTGAAGSAPRDSAWRLSDGRFVVASFKTEAGNWSWWTNVFTILRDTWGCNVAFVSVFNNWNLADDYADPNWVYASSRWGYGADPAVINAAPNHKPEVNARGEKWMAPVVFQDIRPRNSLFDEALNTECLRASWGKAIAQDADLVQMVTWSDFSETPMTVSAHHGWNVLDVSSYFITKWKTGSYPAILRDCIYLSHRSQTLNATITGPTTKPMQHWSRGSMSNVRNDAEVLCFLTAPATVTLTIDGTDHTFNAPAGMSAFNYPVSPGTISARAERSGATVAQVTSPVAVRTSDVSQDRDYYWFSSLRGTTGQFDVLSQYR